MSFLSIGTLLLTFGLFFGYGLFTYPEYFLYGAGLAGLGAVLSPFIAVLVGAGLIYASFRKESTPLKVGSPVRVDDWIAEEALKQGRSEDEEIAYCQRNLARGEKLLLIVASRGIAPEMNRLALTDRRLLLYSKYRESEWVYVPHGYFVSLSYADISDARKRQRAVLTYLADLTFNVKEETVEFKNVGNEWADEVLRTITRMKATRRERSSSMFSPPIQQTKVGGFCGNCGNPIEAGSQYCGICGEKSEQS